MLIGSGEDSTDSPDVVDAVRAFNLAFRQLTEAGYRVTSTLRKPRLLTSSQHALLGGQVSTAADFAVPSDVPLFVQRARLAGVIAIPERTREEARAHGSLDWTAPHIHVQEFPRGQTPDYLRRALPVQISEAP